MIPPPSFTTCAMCGQPAEGFAFIGRRRVCRTAEGTDCYQRAQDGEPFPDEPDLPPTPQRRDATYHAVERLFALHGFTNPRGLQGPLNGDPRA